MLHLVTGCMFAGKTTSLVNTYNLLKIKGKILVIDYDTNQSDTMFTTLLHTHDNITIPCIKMNHLNIDYTYYDYILINEAQFFNGLFDFVKNAVDQHKTVYIYGLDGDFQQNKFGEILDLIPLCDTYEKLYAKCKCGLKASFSKRLSTNKSQFLPNDKYIPVCRNCL
jgi:thymidine kinase